MNKKDVKLWGTVTHINAPTRTGVITGVVKPDQPGIRVCWDNLDVKWHFPQELVVKETNPAPIGFSK